MFFASYKLLKDRNMDTLINVRFTLVIDSSLRQMGEIFHTFRVCHEKRTRLFFFDTTGLEENYCRNPNNSSKPWCYYLDQDNDTTWDYCDIPFCKYIVVGSNLTTMLSKSIALGYVRMLSEL